MSRGESLSRGSGLEDPYGMVYDIMATHFVPGDPNSLITPDAKSDMLAAKRQLLHRFYTPNEIEELVYDAGIEVRQVQAWLHVVMPGDFYILEDFDD